MSLYHFHVGQVKRSAGHTAIAAAAYRSGTKLHCDYYGEDHDYTKKGWRYLFGNPPTGICPREISGQGNLVECG